jgi:lipopolysaccharide transport system ATP-binding protein
MPSAVISVENLGKKYTIRHERGGSRYRRLSEDLVELVKRPFGSLFATPRSRLAASDSALAAPSEEFWALRDVSFNVQQGEVLGIIGRNGAGKSTLLKILSRITEPTAGRVRIRGRVASLLEVGTGFHPELTGRENIFLNGAVLGMSRAEIRKKFDEIVAFAEVEKFLDTPVKHYSSGMYVRLAFAVAAHLDPEILIVDEVLSVGDAAFQKKCLGKIRKISAVEGRTVLFVSHNLHAVRQLCTSAMVLAGGKPLMTGNSSRVVDFYTGADELEAPKVPLPTADLLDLCYVTTFSVQTEAGKQSSCLPIGQKWRACVGFTVCRVINDFVVGLGIVLADGTAVQTAWSQPREIGPGRYEAVFHQSFVVLAAGTYTLVVGLSRREQTLQQVEVARLDIVSQNCVGYYQLTCGAGPVLNSMPFELRTLADSHADRAGLITG